MTLRKNHFTVLHDDWSIDSSEICVVFTTWRLIPSWVTFRPSTRQVSNRQGRNGQDGICGHWRYMSTTFSWCQWAKHDTEPSKDGIERSEPLVKGNYGPPEGLRLGFAQIGPGDQQLTGAYLSSSSQHSSHDIHETNCLLATILWLYISRYFGIMARALIRLKTEFDVL
jgi:hypothetical protein